MTSYRTYPSGFAFLIQFYQFEIYIDYIDLCIYFVGISHSLFIHSPANAPFGCVHFLLLKAIPQQTPLHVSSCTWVEISLWHVTEVKLPQRTCISGGCQITLCYVCQFMSSKANMKPPLQSSSVPGFANHFNFSSLLTFHVVSISTSLTASEVKRLFTQLLTIWAAASVRCLFRLFACFTNRPFYFFFLHCFGLILFHFCKRAAWPIRQLSHF